MVEIAGGVVWNPSLGIAVVSQHGNSWSLPKGHVEAGEAHLETAIREIEEETGIPKTELRFVRPLGKYIRARISKDGKGEERHAPRELSMFLFHTDHPGPLSPLDPDNPEARWIAADEVEAMLTHPRDREFFRSIKAELDKKI